MEIALRCQVAAPDLTCACRRQLAARLKLSRFTTRLLTWPVAAFIAGEAT